MTKPDHADATVCAEVFFEVYPPESGLGNLAACYLELTARHERFAFDCAESRAHLHGKIEDLTDKYEALRDENEILRHGTENYTFTPEQFNRWRNEIHLLKEKYEALRKAAQTSLDSWKLDTNEEASAADAALRSLLEGE